MTFILGLIVGMLITYGTIAVGLYLHYRNGYPTKAFKEAEERFRQKGSVILPRSEHDKTREAITAKNEELGVDTTLEDIL